MRKLLVLSVGPLYIDGLRHDAQQNFEMAIADELSGLYTRRYLSGRSCQANANIFPLQG